MVHLAVDHFGLARSAQTFAAIAVDVDASAVQNLKQGLVRPHIQLQSTVLQDHLECVFIFRVQDRVGCVEMLAIERAVRPVVRQCFQLLKQPRRPASIDFAAPKNGFC